jgi:hypothetical protein
VILLLIQQEFKSHSNTKSHNVHQSKFKLTVHIGSPIDDKRFKLLKFMGLEPEDYTLGFPFDFVTHPDQL